MSGYHTAMRPRRQLKGKGTRKKNEEAEQNRMKQTNGKTLMSKKLISKRQWMSMMNDRQTGCVAKDKVKRAALMVTLHCPLCSDRHKMRWPSTWADSLLFNCICKERRPTTKVVCTSVNIQTFAMVFFLITCTFFLLELLLGL